MVLVGLFGASSSMATGENRQSCHHMTFGADLVFFGGAIWYTASATARSRAENSLAKWGPVIFIAMGCGLLIWDPTRHLILDHGGLGIESRLAGYRDDGSMTPMGHASKMSTHIGVIFLAIGLLWFVGVLEKISKLFFPRALPA